MALSDSCAVRCMLELQSRGRVRAFEQVLAGGELRRQFRVSVPGSDEDHAWDFERVVAEVVGELGLARATGGVLRRACSGPAAAAATTPPDGAAVRRAYAAVLARFPDVEAYLAQPSVVYGLAQSGKSALILAILWVAAYMRRTRGVLVLMNSADSYNQVAKRDLVGFNAWLAEAAGTEDCALCGVGFRGRDRRALADARADPATFVFAMGNGAQLRAVGRALGGSPFLLVADEADVMVKNALAASAADTAVGEAFEALAAQAEASGGGSVRVSATPFGVLNQESSVARRSFFLSPGPHYRGLADFEVRDVAPAVRKDDAALGEVVRQATLRAEGDPRRLRYVAGLVNTEHTNARQAEQAAAIKLAAPPGTRVYVFNSREGGRAALVRDDGSLQPTAFADVQDLFGEFERGPERGRYVIVSSMRAGRAVSFRPRPGAGAGGLAYMVYAPADTTHCAAMIQALRVCGNYPPEYPTLALWCPRRVRDAIDAELANIRRMVDLTSAALCDTRAAIVGHAYSHTGGYAHDRRDVDDTRLVSGCLLRNAEYATPEQALGALRFELKGALDAEAVVMTLPLLRLRVPGFQYVKKDASAQARLRREVHAAYAAERGWDAAVAGAGAAGKPTMQIAWDAQRYDDLHDLHRRYSRQNRAGGAVAQPYCARLVVGEPLAAPGTWDSVPVVEWKAEFCAQGFDPAARLQGGRAYLYQTTRGTWRVYARDAATRAAPAVMVHSVPAAAKCVDDAQEIYE